jgi:dTDP-glucose 4,6-dehydratase
VYNVGARQEIPNIEVVRRILKILGKDEKLITFVEDRPGHDKRYAIDSSKIETQLGWRANVLFDAGLRETVDWYRQNSSWMEHVRNGEYLTYYDQMYRQRQRTLSER